MPAIVSLALDFKGEALMLVVKSFQVDNMHVGRDRTIDKILLVDIHIHICDCPSDLLSLDLPDLLPVVRVLGIEQNNIRLTGAIVQVAF